MWIGLSKRESGFGWTDGSALAYINWAAGEPNNWEGSQEDCVEMFSNGYWNDEVNKLIIRSIKNRHFSNASVNIHMHAKLLHHLKTVSMLKLIHLVSNHVSAVIHTAESSQKKSACERLVAAGIRNQLSNVTSRKFILE